MREPYTQLYVHLMWATWDRLPLLTPERQKAAFACIHAECTQMRAEVLAVGGVEDHVHLLVRVPATITVASLVRQVKGASSHLLTHQIPGADGFKWQGAYGAFTVSHRDVPIVKDYVRGQAQHHGDGSILS
ncbi:MAG TPA: IS200/IS605 family transposase [Armatimonadota bacterium]